MNASSDVTAYAAQVRAALADLPEQQRLDLLEDLEDHLAEVAADTGEPLEARLGPPAAYAQELRQAALALPSAPNSGRLHAALGDARRDAHRLWQSEPLRAAREFLPELRPAWWVLRGYLVVAVVGAVLGSPLLVPLGPVLGLPLLLAAIVLSVRLGRRSAARAPGTSSRWIVVANTALAALAVAFVIGVQSSGEGPVYAEPYYGPYGPYGYPGEEQVLRHEDGSPITNLFPRTSDGEPLDGVLLYDQDGRAVDNLATTTFEGEEVRPLAAPGEPPAPSNSYPQEQEVLRYDEFGGLVPASPRPSPTASPSPSPSSAPSLSPSPSLSLSLSPSAELAPPAPDPAAPTAPPPAPVPSAPPSPAPS